MIKQIYLLPLLYKYIVEKKCKISLLTSWCRNSDPNWKISMEKIYFIIPKEK